jgi:hypothetical protein
MDVWAFLNWLWGQIDKVLVWFSGQFWTWLSYLKDFFRWLDAYTTLIYNEAVTWASNAINNVKAWATNLYNYLASLIAQIYDDATSYARQLYNRAIDYANSLIDAVTSYAVSLYHKALDAIQGVLDYLIAWAVGQIAAARDFIIHLFDPLLVLVPILSVLLLLTDKNIVTKLITFAQTIYGEVVAFFEDPLGFILGLIWTQAVTFFCFVLGYGLGSVNATLPPIPVWGKGGAGGGVIPPYIPPNGGGDLAHPIDPIFVTGYTFGPGHPGVDLGLVMGQEVHAAHSGVITYAGWDSSGYGNRVDISGVPYWTRYGHNQAILVTAGQTVNKGDIISRGNSTGNSTGPHLHFELKVNGSYVDPLLYL